MSVCLGKDMSLPFGYLTERASPVSHQDSCNQECPSRRNAFGMMTSQEEDSCLLHKHFQIEHHRVRL